MVGLLALGACGGEGPATDPAEESSPLGMPLRADGVIYAGASVVDLTPEILETFDASGGSTFNGCFDDPTGERCGQGFDDVNGNGIFDAVFIGGFGPRRPANDVRDPVEARAAVFAYDGGYIALVSLDLVGVGHPRIDDAGALLAAEGFDPDRLIVTATHNHQGPDTMGLWGDPLGGLPGFDEAYQERVAEAVADAVREAAAQMVPVTLKVGAQRMRDRGPDFNGASFGGRNPTAKMHGMVNDKRDPVVVSDQVLVVQALREEEVVFTLTSWSGHPEVRGSDNNHISSDWVGVTRQVLEDRYGGVALHIPECLGGMQSALSGDLPLVLEDGTHVMATCDADAVADAADEACFEREVGAAREDDFGPVPVWAPKSTWDFVTSHGWHIAEAAISILDAASTYTEAPIRLVTTTSYVPIRNAGYNLLGPQGIFDIGLDEATLDPALCPQAVDVELGCLPFRTSRFAIGPVGFVTAPGELVPELFWGLPTDDPQWVAEASDPSARGPGAVYFPQHDPACDDVDPRACVEVDAIGDCDCLAIHDWPYVISPDPTHEPLVNALDTEFKAAISMTSTNLSYILPETSVNKWVSLLRPRNGDHYEDTVTPAWEFGTIYLEAQRSLDDAWADAQ